MCLCERDEDHLNGVQRRVTKILDDMVEKTYENSLKELGLLSRRRNLPDAAI